jgi:hypothetical protein
MSMLMGGGGVMGAGGDLALVGELAGDPQSGAADGVGHRGPEAGEGIDRSGAHDVVRES